MKYILLITIIFGIFSCCTKEDCTGDPPPVFIIISNEKTISVEIKLVDENFNLLETKNYDDGSYISISKSEFLKIDNSIKDYTYLILRKNKIDTLQNIKYDETETIQTCNKCFGFIGGKQVKTKRFFNFKHLFNGKISNGNTHYYE
ncbi:MAG: hypothetical protein EAZ53_10325 [Bacteroidetes bacterium]|nr:MAG: hypothetical protein EAZ53_10325 [Bacteroidota bacterium]